MLEFFRRLFAPEPRSGETAKERLRLVLLSDHLSLAPDVVEALKADLLTVISRYLEIDPALADVTFEQREREVAMLANIPIMGVRERGTAAAPAAAVLEPVAATAAPVAPDAAEFAPVAEPAAEAPAPAAAAPAPVADAAVPASSGAAIEAFEAAGSAALAADAARAIPPRNRRRRRKKAAASAGPGAPAPASAPGLHPA